MCMREDNKDEASAERTVGGTGDKRDGKEPWVSCDH